MIVTFAVLLVLASVLAILMAATNPPRIPLWVGVLLLAIAVLSTLWR